MSKGEKLEEVKQLISLGKEKGYLTYDELNSSLPPDLLASDRFDNLMMMFGEMDIDVVDGATDTAGQSLGAESDEVISPVAEALEDRTALIEDEKEAALDFSPGMMPKTDDPVRLYLREIGSVPLLSREGEIEIAKRIEVGQREIALAIWSQPISLNWLFALGEQLHQEHITMGSLLAPSDEGEFETGVGPDAEKWKLKSLKTIRELRPLATQLQNFRARRQRVKPRSPGAEKLELQILAVSEKLVKKIESIGLAPQLIEEHVRKLKMIKFDLVYFFEILTTSRRFASISSLLENFTILSPRSKSCIETLNSSGDTAICFNRD